MRLHLTLALITALLLVITLRPNERHRFTFAKVQALAQQLTQTPYVPLPDSLPPQLRKLTSAQELGVFWNDKYRLWRKNGLPFQVDFYHLSNEGPTSPKINMVDSRRAHALLLPYSSAFFNDQVPFNPPLPPNLGYSGFYVRYPINKPDALDGFFSVLGASYFRALAKDQVYGLSARGLAINAGVDGRPEEFPEFKEWWLHEPDPNATELVLDALLDSASVTGAYEFKLHPGAVTSVDIHAVLFFRQKVEWLGIAPFSSMYLYGENAPNHFGNFHPEIHDSDGLLVNTGKGDWLWRPLEQEPLFQIYKFNDENPKGFGLLQRDRDFQHYQDLNLKYNVRPSAWVTPHGNWGKGAVVLAHRPSDNPNTDNVVLFWHPDQIPRAGDRMVLDYTIDFYMNDAARPPLAYSNATWVINPAPPPAPTVGTLPALNAVKQNILPPAPASAPPPSPGWRHTGSISDRFRRQRNRGNSRRQAALSLSAFRPTGNPAAGLKPAKNRLWQFMAGHLHHHPVPARRADRTALPPDAKHPAPKQRQAPERKLELHLAPMNASSANPVDDEQAAWNQAHDRLQDFLKAFVLGDHAQVSRLTLKLLNQARELHRRDPSLAPVSLTMAQAQKLTEEWFAENLEMRDQPASRLLASGCVALLLSRAFRDAPETFLTSPLPENLKETMRRTLLITGPDLKISSMTPRHIDYGPILGLARTTWQRWKSPEIIIALLFWAGVYFVFYWWLSDAL